MQYDRDNAQSVQKSIFYPLSAQHCMCERHRARQRKVMWREREVKRESEMKGQVKGIWFEWNLWGLAEEA